MAESIGPLANWRVISETRRRPAVAVGISADRIGAEKQTLFAVVAKDLMPLVGIPVAPYIGLLREEGDDRVRVPFGASVRMSDRWSLLPVHDGTAFHLMASFHWDQVTLTGILVRARDPGLSLTLGL
ncbi:MAG: hypothetical protein HY321_02225 [Armatimonadetes bacterium]|nr:hypothetical protein [Armatimonadota bacterium]